MLIDENGMRDDKQKQSQPQIKNIEKKKKKSKQ